jgi:hypothetical protein
MNIHKNARPEVDPERGTAEPLLRCNRAGFDIGSDRRGCDGWVDGSAIYLIKIKFLIGGCACGDVGEGEHFPAFRVGSGSGGSAAGRQRRSSTYPQTLLVNLPRRAIAEALVLALRVVKVQPGANTGFGLGHCRISVQVDLLVFGAAPQSLDKDVVHATAFAVHADHDGMPPQDAGEVATGEPTALVGIEDLRPGIARECFLKRFDAKIGAGCVGEAPCQHRTAHPVRDDH